MQKPQSLQGQFIAYNLTILYLTFSITKRIKMNKIFYIPFF